MVGGRIPFETCGVERVVLQACMHACMRDVVHAVTPLLLKDELCPFLHIDSLLPRQKQD